MTGFKSDALRHECATVGCYIERLPSWEWMRGCFPRDIFPTDIDGMVEIAGRVLFVEQKGVGVPLLQGQRIALKRLASKDGVTVLYLREIADTTDLEALVIGDGEPQGFQRKTLDELRAWLAAWAVEAERAA